MDERTCIEPGCTRVAVARGLCRRDYYRRKNAGRPMPPKSSKTFAEWYAEVEKPDDGCWYWTGGVSKYGYGYAGGRGGAHLWSYRENVGPIPEGMDVGHTCHDADPTCPGGWSCLHRLCVRPDHLTPMTRRDNLAATPNSSARRSARQSRGRCGHLLEMPNLVQSALARGRRQCRSCAKARAMAQWQATRTIVVAVEADRIYGELMGGYDASWTPRSA